MAPSVGLRCVDRKRDRGHKRRASEIRRAHWIRDSSLAICPAMSAAVSS